MLQKSKVAAPRIFRENKKPETIADSYTLNRVAEVAGEIDARGSVPSRLYTKDAPTALRIFDHLCKTTFATQSANSMRGNRTRQWNVGSPAIRAWGRLPLSNIGLMGGESGPQGRRHDGSRAPSVDPSFFV
jgi:hypothetical protein